MPAAFERNYGAASVKSLPSCGCGSDVVGVVMRTRRAVYGVSIARAPPTKSRGCGVAEATSPSHQGAHTSGMGSDAFAVVEVAKEGRGPGAHRWGAALPSGMLWGCRGGVSTPKVRCGLTARRPFQSIWSKIGFPLRNTLTS